MSNKNPEKQSENTPESVAGEWPQRLELLRGLAAVAKDEQLAEVELEQNGVRITLRAESALQADNAPMIYSGSPAPAGVLPPVVAAAAAAPAGAAPSTPGAAASKPVDENLVTIVSPMVGMFYRAPSPSDPNFVEVGDKVEVGQTVALVEAMKVFNEITAEVAGTVVEIKAGSGDLVETGQVLMTIK